MPTVSRGFVHQDELKEEIAQVVRTLDSNEVREVHFRLGTDAGGEPAIFFGIVLSANASRDERIGAVTGKISETLFDELQPYNRWGLLPYFDYTSDRAFYTGADWT